MSLLYALGGAPMWNHAGSWTFSCLERRRGAKVSFVSLAVLMIDRTQYGRVLARGPLDGGDQEVRGNAGGFGGMFGWREFIIASVMKAHLGLSGDRSRYDFSLMMSIALFLVFIFSSCIPPSSLGEYSLAILIVGGAVDSQMKSLMILVRASSICFGIPWAAVRNCDIPPANIWVMCLFASREGWPLFHFCRVDLILSRIGSHGSAAFVALPIQAPRHLTAFPSSAMRMPCWRGGSSVFTLRVVQILCLWVGVPIGITSVFSKLNQAPDAMHHLDRIFWRDEYESVSDR